MKRTLKFIFLSVAICMICFIQTATSFSSEIDTKSFSKSFLSLSIDEKIVGGDEFHTVTKGEGVHDYSIYLHRDDIMLLKMRFPKYPRCNYITDDILEISYRNGTTESYRTYFDTRRGLVSDMFKEGRLTDDGKYIYYVSDIYSSGLQNKENRVSVLVVRDIFLSQVLYYTVHKDFSHTIEYYLSPILDIKVFEDKYLLYIKYAKGDEMEIAEEMLDMRLR